LTLKKDFCSKLQPSGFNFTLLFLKLKYYRKICFHLAFNHPFYTFMFDMFRISGIRWRDQILIRSWSGGQILDPAQPYYIPINFLNQTLIFSANLLSAWLNWEWTNILCKSNRVIDLCIIFIPTDRPYRTAWEFSYTVRRCDSP